MRLTPFTVTAMALGGIAILMLLGVGTSWIVESVSEKPAAEWAPGELTTMVVERRLETTGLIDMGWMFMHNDFSDVEEAARKGVEKVIAEACETLTDDEKWAVYVDGDINQPCQPIGCDNGYHLKGCPFAAIDV